MRHKKAKLLFVSHDSRIHGGAERSLLALVQSAILRGYEVHVVVPRRQELYRALQQQGTSVHRVRYGWWDAQNINGSDTLLSISNLSKLIDKVDPEVIITNSSVSPWGAIAASLCNKPHIWLLREFPDGNLDHLKRVYPFIFSVSNAVFANSRQLAKLASQADTGKTAGLFYSYVDVANIKLKPAHGKPSIIAIGGIQPSKNQLEILKALAILQKKNVTLSTTFIGPVLDKTYGRQLHSFIEENELSNVTFTGSVENPWNLVKANDIFVHPSQTESLGRTTTEAMKLGLVCIGSNISGTKEAFATGDGLLYKLGSANELADKIMYVIDNSEQGAKLANRARLQALRNLSEKAAHDSLFKAVESIRHMPNPMGEWSALRQLFTNTAVMYSAILKELKVRQSLIEELQGINKQLETELTKNSHPLKRFLG